MAPIPYSAVRKGENALVRTYGPGGNISVGYGQPTNPNVRWEWAQQGDYAKYKAAEKAAAGKKPGTAAASSSPYAGQVARNSEGVGGPVSSALGGATAPGTGSTNPFVTDPGYLSALAAEQTGDQQADNALRAAQEQAIVAFGDPSLASAAGLTVNPLTAAMAQASTRAGTSTVAGLQRTRDENKQAILDSLAAHGMLQSGQTGYATGRNEQAYGRDLFGATQTALSGLNTAAATNVSNKQDLHSDTTNALLTAYQTYVQSPQFWGAAGVGTTPAAASPTGATTPTPRAAAAPQAAPPPGFQRSGYGFVPIGAQAKTTKALVRPALRPQVARNIRMG